MKQTNSIVLHNPLDMHLHLRDATMLQLVAPLSARYFSGAVIMPNLVPPITTQEQLLSYKNKIISSIHNEQFEPMMTLFFKEYSPKFLEDIKNDIFAIKLYPAGITTNSENGIKKIDIKKLATTLQTMSDLGIVLCVHGETNGFVMDREKEFLPTYEELAKSFPKLKIVMEHITTKDAVKLLDDYENLYATITLHHLLITLDDLAGGLLNPHLFCKPIAKRYEDKEALLDIALKAHPKVMFGSDSAPHPKNAKENCGCAAGIFTAPIALQTLAQLFEKHNSLNNLQQFISNNAINIHNLQPIQKTVTLVKETFQVPENYSYKSETVVPMYAKEQLSWNISSATN